MLETLVIVPHSEHVYYPGNIISQSGDKVTVKLLDGEGEVEAKSSELIRDIPPALDETDDMTKLEQLHESIILHALRKRWEKQIIYTYIGPMIISINPHQFVERYSAPGLVKKYMEKDRDELEPHLFSVAQKAYRNLIDMGYSQSMIISGESGSGKTEATKIILNFLTEASNQEGDELDLAAKIQSTNPIMEAFGNAKTTRNNNSSRFGKLIKIIFDGDRICGAQIDNYLLEKTRVIKQAPEERNYHIFYQIINYCTPEQRQKYKIMPEAEKYVYMSNGNLPIPLPAGRKKVDYDDEEQFKQVQKGFETLQFTKEEIDDIFSLLSAILWLGNITITAKDDCSHIENQDALENFSDLLGYTPQQVKQAITQTQFQGKNSVRVKPHNLDVAMESRNAMAKALYAGLFTWLVNKLNVQLKGTGGVDSKFIGVLDIYGFEDFRPKKGGPNSARGAAPGRPSNASTSKEEPKNSMEQFLINFANEKLHQQFTKHMFLSEQEEYAKEGVNWDKINFTDNDDCIKLIENIILFYKDKSTLPKTDDQKTVAELLQKFQGKNMSWQKPDFSDGIFAIGVKHYAGPVIYNCEGWNSKNADKLWDEVEGLFRKSSNLIVKTFAPPVEAPSGPAAPGLLQRKPAGPSKAVQKKPVADKFKDDLTRLVDVLNACERHYVRCIKPNDEKTPVNPDSHKIINQLRCNGVFETIKLRKEGYSQRLPFERFEDKFWICLGDKYKGKDGIDQFLQTVLPGQNPVLWVVGHTKVLCKDKALEALQIKLKESWAQKTAKAQAFIRTYYYSTLFQKKRENIKIIQRVLRKYRAMRHFQISRLRVIRLQKNIRTYNAKVLLAKYKKEWEEKTAACTIMQRFTRRLYSLIEYEKLYRDWQAKRLRYSIVIQSRIRSYISQVQLILLRKEYEVKRLNLTILFQSLIRKQLAEDKLYILRKEHERQEELKLKTELEREAFRNQQEAARKQDEENKRQEAARKQDEENKRREAAKKQDEENKRLEAAKKQEEENKRRDAAKKQEEENKRLEAARKQDEENKRLEALKQTEETKPTEKRVFQEKTNREQEKPTSVLKTENPTFQLQTPQNSEKLSETPNDHSDNIPPGKSVPGSKTDTPNIEKSSAISSSTDRVATLKSTSRMKKRKEKPKIENEPVNIILPVPSMTEVDPPAVKSTPYTSKGSVPIIPSKTSIRKSNLSPNKSVPRKEPSKSVSFVAPKKTVVDSSIEKRIDERKLTLQKAMSERQAKREKEEQEAFAQWKREEETKLKEFKENNEKRIKELKEQEEQRARELKNKEETRLQSWKVEEAKRKKDEELDNAIQPYYEESQLSETDKNVLKEFMKDIYMKETLSIQYIHVFFLYNISVDTLLYWDNVKQEILNMGITDIAFLNAIDKAVEIERHKKLQDENHIQISLSFLQSRVVLQPQFSSWGSWIAGHNIYARCDVREERNSYRRVGRYRTQQVSSLNPVWTTDKRQNFIIPAGWYLWIEICDSSWTGDDMIIAESCISFNQLLHFSDQETVVWFPLKYLVIAPEGQEGYLGYPSGEIQLKISNHTPVPLEWEQDQLLENFEIYTIPLLHDATYSGQVNATLIRHVKSKSLSKIGLLYIHDFSDYFWQSDMAITFLEEKYSFYALDLRKYGRSSGTAPTSNWVKSFEEYFEEIHHSISLMRQEGVEKIYLLGLGVGGTISALYGASHPDLIEGLILLSPQLALNDQWQSVLSNSKSLFSGVNPQYKDIKFSQFYHQSLHSDYQGKWEWDLDLKPIKGHPVYAGWVSLLETTIANITNKDITIPVLVLISDNSSISGTVWADNYLASDLLVNVENLKSLVPKLGKQVKLHEVKNAMHDILHSQNEDSIKESYQIITEWLRDASSGSFNKQQKSSFIFKAPK